MGHVFYLYSDVESAHESTSIGDVPEIQQKKTLKSNLKFLKMGKTHLLGYKHGPLFYS